MRSTLPTGGTLDIDGDGQITAADFGAVAAYLNLSGAAGIGKGDGGLFSGRNADGTFTLPDRHGEQSHFSEQGLLTSRLDRVGNATTFSYIDLDSDDVPDALSGMVEPGGRTTTFAYSGGRLQTITDFAGRVTTLTYDAAERLTTVTRPDPDGSGSPELEWPGAVLGASELRAREYRGRGIHDGIARALLVSFLILRPATFSAWRLATGP